MKSVALTVFPRSQTRRNGVKKLRSAERIPAVIYGRQKQSQNVEVGELDFGRLFTHGTSENLLVDLDIQGDARPKRLALVQEVQHHPVKDRVLHVDFHEVAPDEKVTITVPVEAVGDCAGVKAGGTLEHVLFKLKVRGLPKNLPETIQADVTNLEMGKSIHIGDIVPPAEIEVLGAKKIVVISCAAPMTEAQEAAAEAAATATPGAEPEMIKEKKEEGEEGAAAPADKKAAEAGKPAEKAAKPAEKAAEKPEKKKK